MRNNSASSSAGVDVTFLDSAGGIVSSSSRMVSRQSIDNFTPPSGFSGSAVVAASQDVSVVVENVYNSGGRYMATAYPGASAPATVVYAPLVFKKWPHLKPAWRQTTDLVIQNPSSQQANVTITFYDSWGSYSGSHAETRTVPANGQITVSGTEMPVWESAYGGSLASAVVASDQAVTVVAHTLIGVANSGGSITTPYLAGAYSAFSSGANQVYLPTAAREYYNYDTGLQVQNLSGGNTTFTIAYYELGQASPTLTLTQTVGSRRSVNFWRPEGLGSEYLGSAVVNVVSGGPVAAVGQYDHVNTGQSRYGMSQYEGITAGTRSEVLAHVGRGSPWTYTGVLAQNMGSSTTKITLDFYHASGAPGGSPDQNGVPPNASALFYESGIPIDSGSAVVSSEPVMPVGLMVNWDRLESSSWRNKDGMMGYGGVR